MFDHALQFFVRSWRALSELRWRWSAYARRLGRACRYATHSLSANQAQIVILDCELPAGWRGLMTLTVEDTLERARERYADHPHLEDFIALGCSVVAHRWEDYEGRLAEAQDWAIKCAVDFAAQGGVALAGLDDMPAARDGDTP